MARKVRQASVKSKAARTRKPDTREKSAPRATSEAEWFTEWEGHRIRRLHVEVFQWRNMLYTRNLPTETQALVCAVARILKAAFDAYVTEDIVELEKLEKEATRALHKMRDAAWQRRKTWMVDIGRFERSGGWTHPLGDVVPAKGDPFGVPFTVQGIINTLARYLGDNLTAGDLAEEFLGFAMTGAHTAFEEIRVVHFGTPEWSGSVDRITSAFEQRLRDRRVDTDARRRDVAERLWVAGLKALGVPHKKAENSLSFKRRHAETV